jgi:acetoin utilization deacetylase AcuC-like enzyme
MLGVVSHPDCRSHDPGPLHPDRPERLDAIQNQIISSGLDFVIRHYDAPLASRAALKAVHDDAYVERIFAMAPESGEVVIDGDTVMNPHSLAAARRAAGAGILAVDLLMIGEASAVFCAVRPPGHHAERNKAMGFCLFNNVAVATAQALNTHGLQRVAVLDFDVHHGNGTEDIFKNDGRVLLCSSFQHPFYPGTGHASDTLNLVSVPLSAGTDGATFRVEISKHWFPALEAFKPEMIVVSAGFDGHVLDDMSSLCLTEHDYAWVTEKIMETARRHAKGRVVSMLEGGYETGALARSVVAHLKVMI